MTENNPNAIELSAVDLEIAVRILQDVSQRLWRILEDLPLQLSPEGIRNLHETITALLRENGFDYPIPNNTTLLALALSGPWTVQTRVYLHQLAVEHVRQLKLQFDSALDRIKKNP